MKRGRLIQFDYLVGVGDFSKTLFRNNLYAHYTVEITTYLKPDRMVVKLAGICHKRKNG